MPTLVAVVVDHRLYREGLATVIRKLEHYDVHCTAENGRDLLDQLQQSSQLPDIVLVDLNMRVMDGVETTARLQQLYPAIRVLALLMVEQEEPIRLLKQNGARGYFLKEFGLEELRQALNDVMTKGYYTPGGPVTRIIRNLNTSGPNKSVSAVVLTEREHEFLKLASSESTYTEIAARMAVSLSTVEAYRDAVFRKLNVQTRDGMIIEARNRGLIDP